MSRRLAPQKDSNSNLNASILEYAGERGRKLEIRQPMSITAPASNANHQPRCCLWRLLEPPRMKAMKSRHQLARIIKMINIVIENSLATFNRSETVNIINSVLIPATHMNGRTIRTASTLRMIRLNFSDIVPSFVNGLVTIVCRWGEKSNGGIVCTQWSFLSSCVQTDRPVPKGCFAKACIYNPEPHSTSDMLFVPISTSPRIICRTFSGSSNMGLWVECSKV